MIRSTVGYAVAVSRDPGHAGWVRVTLRKHFWQVRAGGRSRLVAETGFYSAGMSEREIVESALRELLRTYVDEIG